MRALIVVVAALSLTGCNFFNDPKEPSERVLRRAAPAAIELPPNAAIMTADQWLQQSLAYYKGKRFLECVAAAQTAILLKPDLAEAWNNMGVAYSEMHLWDLAIQAESQALRINPNFQLARNNIAWAQSQKKSGAK